MNGAWLARFPHHGWLHFRVSGSVDARPLTFTMRSVAHSVSLTLHGCHAVRMISGGAEHRWEAPSGAVHFMPADGEQRTFVTTMSPDCQSAVFLIPEGQLRACLDAEGVDSPSGLHRFLSRHDPILEGCLVRLAAAASGSHDPAGADEAARRLVLRLAECAGAGPPAWHHDASTFDRRTVSSLVEHIDAHLRVTPGLTEMAVLAGLSPSHFARKFRLSTGLSLHRFVNQRRLLQALERLRSPAASLAYIALELGFSSQSHFTRLFSLLTGMTPAKYAKVFRRAIG